MSASRFAVIISFLLLTMAGTVAAKPVTDQNMPRMLEGEPIAWPGPAGSPSLSVGLFTDTVTYGGTVWAPDSMRWEALRDNCWTFDTGVGSSINTGQNPNKPIGYHQTMEGWTGIDQTLNRDAFFRRSSTCAINGSFSFWAGVSIAEAESLCYASGQGYGNSWNFYLTKTFTYPGSGSAQLSYKYAVNAEPGFDYTYVLIDTTGTGAQPGVVLASYNGVVSGTANHTLTPGSTLRSTAGPVTIKFNAQSDGSYSDQDGLYPTLCGHTAIDDVTLTGAIVDFANFESGDDGWSQFIPTTGVGDLSNLAGVATLPVFQPTFCPCGVRDSVLVFFDTLMGHPLDQDNIAASPWINLRRPGNTGDLGRPLKLMLYSAVQDMPIANYVFIQIRVRYYPAVCTATGKIYRTPWLDQNIAFPDTGPFCTAPGTTRIRDYSGVIGSSAEQIQVAWGMLNLCSTEPFDIPCTGTTNSTPWLDNIALGIGGPKLAPSIVLLTFDALQDAFAEDGTLNPSATGRFDTNTIKDASNPLPGTHLRDTLVVRMGTSTNTEVRMYFMVRPGPFTNPVTLGARAARWTPAPSITPKPGAFGNTWYYARMDTAEQGGTVSNGNYMATFHESSSGFLLNDRVADPLDPNQLENEILPDHVLTPGSRVDYFLAARYIPPDPRNVGGVNWFLERDTANSRTREVEILPTSMGPDTTWNCVLYVDHHGDRNFDDAYTEETGLTLALGAGGNTKEGTRYDRFDNETPSSGQLSFGRAIQTNYGASINQIFAYKVLVWHSATLASVDLTDEDANMIRPWLTLASVGGNSFWCTGDGLVRSMNSSNEVATLSFMKDILGVLAVCNTIREANCPTGSILDSTSCIATTAVGGSHFTTATSTSARSNGCNSLRSFDVNSVNPAVPTAKGQLAYVKNGSAVNYLSVTNHNTAGVEYKTVVDGAALGALRTTTGTPNNLALCSIDETAAYSRTMEVLSWFGAPLVCRPILTTGTSGDDELPETPKYRTSLGNAVPNPMNGSTRISFENEKDGGRVRIEIIDVTGRAIRTLVDSEFPAGTQNVTWDGRNDRGAGVAAGLYFYRMTSGAVIQARKVLVMK